MMLLRASAGAARQSGDPAHPHVRLTVPGARSAHDLDRVARHLALGECVHVTVVVSRGGLLPIGRRRVGATGAEVRERLTDLMALAGPDARRVLVRVEHEPPVLRRWWDAWAWRRGVGGPGGPRGREHPLPELLAPVVPRRDDQGPCAGRPHVRAAAEAPLAWDVIDELHRSVSVGREAHLVLTVPRSPVVHDPELHVLWERCVALDVADRRHEVAHLWPDSSLVRIEVEGRRADAEEAPRGRG